jgi:hypothetical protein
MAEEVIRTTDAKGNPLEGDKNYVLHLPPDIPASNFWSVIVYDSQTCLMIRTDQSWPSVHSNCKRLVVNYDGSVDAWFGPVVPPGKENNWVKTLPGKRWFMIFRLYDPLETWFNKSWRPGEIEEIIKRK